MQLFAWREITHLHGKRLPNLSHQHLVGNCFPQNRLRAIAKASQDDVTRVDQRDVTGPYLLTSFTGNINNFNVIFLLSGGKPLSLDLDGNAGHTDLLITWLYKMTVNDTNYKLAAVMGILVFIVSAVINLVVYNMIPSIKNEEDFQ